MSDEHLRNDNRRDGYGDAVSVLKFAEVMMTKLGENAWKAPWGSRGVKTGFLLKRLDAEVRELRRAWKKKNYAEIQREAADVANFAMMIADLARRETEAHG